MSGLVKGKSHMQKITNYYLMERGISRPLVGEVDNQKYIFKIKNVKPDKEIFIAHLLKQVGILTPEVRYERFLLDGKQRKFLQTEYIDGALALDQLFLDVCKGDQSKVFRYFQLSDFQQIQLLDILIANLDRSASNVMISDHQLFAIDHSKALISKMGFTHEMSISEIFRILISNPLGLYILKNFDQYSETYLSLLCEIETRFSEEVIQNALDQVSNWWNQEKSTRIQETLLIRRGLLKQRFESLIKIMKENERQMKRLVQLLERNEVISYDTLTRCVENISKR